MNNNLIKKETIDLLIDKVKGNSIGIRVEIGDNALSV